MKRLLIACVATMLLSCSKQGSDGIPNNSSTVSVDNDSIKTTIVKSDNDGPYLTSTYDNPSNGLKQHKASLKELSDSSIFSVIHSKLLPTLSKKHQVYFTFKPEYELLYSSTGDLFQNNKEDNAFIIYDKTYSRISIVVFDDLQNQYSELFRDIKVKNGLEKECNYSSLRTLDYQVAYELIYQRDYLIKDALKQMEYSTCKIVDISKDENFVLESGCFAPNFSPDRKIESFCIPTSSVYNNWECLIYDKIKSEFTIVYSQAFAD